VTHNFDPERWYEIRLARLDERRALGEISDEDHRAEVADLERRYEELLQRLDGTFQIPKAPVDG
jgi:hypothetical protein